MKRREFIVNSAVAITGAMVLSGCKKRELLKSENQVTKRKYKDIYVPLLALGCMRLPMTKNNVVDMVELDKMVQYCMEHGANYFDTAYMYVNGTSEECMGKVLSKYKRSDFFLASKSPIYKMNSKEDVRKIFDEQRKRCKVDYFDFYMAHNINQNTYDTYKKVDMYNELLKLKDEGLIKYLGFSFHGTPDILKEVVSKDKWDFAQLQVNYLDWDVVKAHQQYDIVQQKGIPVTVMEPLRGGGLVNLSEKALNKLKEKYPNETPASFGLRWAASQNNVVTVLSGMSNLEQVKQNIDTFTNFKPMDKNELKVADEISKIIQSQGEINCTACKYCLEVCPREINIPAIFQIYNQYKVTKNKMFFGIYYNTLNEDERADKCINCSLCTKNCPQALKIPELLKKIDSEVKTLG